MSVITHMLVLANEDVGAEPLRELHRWCREHADGQVFEKIETSAAGGGKVFTRRVYACSGNYFPYEELLAAFPKLGWNSYSAEVSCLIVQNEHDERWIAVHGDGARVERSVRDARCPPLREPPPGGEVIRCGGGAAYWSCERGNWTRELEDATVFRGAHAAKFMAQHLTGDPTLEVISLAKARER